MPQLDPSTFVPQLVWLAITFLALYVLMAKVALPRVARAIDARTSRIADDLAEARRLRTESEQVLAAYERALSEARAESQVKIRETMKKLDAENAQREHAAAARLAEETTAAEARIMAARTTALANVRTIAIETARQIAGKLVGAEPDEGRAGAAVDMALKEHA